MKNISLKTVVVTGAVFMIITGSLLHFTYEWSGNNPFVAIFSAASESVWEHGKMFLLPLAIVSFVEYFKIKDLSKILWVSLLQLLFMIGFIITFFYTYTGAFGFESVIIDVLLFVAAVIIGQSIAYKQLNSESEPVASKYLSGVALVAIFLTFVVITFYPPKLPVFTPHNPTTNSQGTQKKSQVENYRLPPTIDHIVIIVDENRTLSSLIGNSKAPYINKIAKEGAYATNYHAVTKNPYIALTSGSATNIPNSCNPRIAKCQTQVANITDEIEKSGRTWKMYAESMPKSCGFNDSKKYAVRHNPFMYYPSISKNSAQCSSQIVPLDRLKYDLDSSTLPNYSFISPNLCNDMHNCSINTGDRWLAKNIPIILSSSSFTTQKSLLIITWDEGSKTDNKVLTIFLGPSAKKGYVSTEAHNHYSILRTIEYVWSLKPLTNNDKHASLMDDMLN